MTLLPPEIKPKTHYQLRSLSALSREEQDLFLNTPKNKATIYLSEQDAQYIKENNLNIARIGFFVLREWLAKKRLEWGDLPVGE